MIEDNKSTSKERKKKYDKEYKANNPDKDKKHRETYYLKHKEEMFLRTKNCRLKRTYGISLEDFEIMFEYQNKRCKICLDDLADFLCDGRTSTKIVIDHCHRTGMVRGIICCRCNFMLGHARDSIIILERGIRYLENAEKAYLEKISLADYHDDTEPPELEYLEPPEC